MDRSRRRPGRSRALQQLAEVLDVHVGAAPAPRLGLSGAVDADDPTEASGTAGLHPGLRVLEHGRLGRVRAEHAPDREERVRRGLAGQPLPLGDRAVHDLLEEVVDAGGHEHVPAVRARGDHRAAQPAVTHRLGEAHGPLVGLYALPADQLQHQVVLPRAEPVHRLGLRRVGGRAHRQLDAARPEERVHAVEARLAVDVLVVVGGPVELLKRLAGAIRPVPQELVEHLLPRVRMHLRGLCENAVQIEQAGRDALGNETHGSRLPADCPLPAPGSHKERPIPTEEGADGARRLPGFRGGRRRGGHGGRVLAPVWALRALASADVLYNAAVADRLGISPIDMRYLSWLDSQGAATAGHLARWSGLTTGAITGVINRLKRAGL